MIYVLKIIWDYRVSLLELIVRNIARYPLPLRQSATNPLYAIYYLDPTIPYTMPGTLGRARPWHGGGEAVLVNEGEGHGELNW
jgi:hypothetical protein